MTTGGHPNVHNQTGKNGKTGKTDKNGKTACTFRSICVPAVAGSPSCSCTLTIVQLPSIDRQGRLNLPLTANRAPTRLASALTQIDASAKSLRLVVVASRGNGSELSASTRSRRRLVSDQIGLRKITCAQLPYSNVRSSRRVGPPYSRMLQSAPLPRVTPLPSAKRKSAPRGAGLPAAKSRIVRETAEWIRRASGRSVVCPATSAFDQDQSPSPAANPAAADKFAKLPLRPCHLSCFQRVFLPRLFPYSSTFSRTLRCAGSPGRLLRKPQHASSSISCAPYALRPPRRSIGRAPAAFPCADLRRGSNATVRTTRGKPLMTLSGMRAAGCRSWPVLQLHDFPNLGRSCDSEISTCSCQSNGTQVAVRASHRPQSPNLKATFNIDLHVTCLSLPDVRTHLRARSVVLQQSFAYRCKQRTDRFEEFFRR